MQELAKILEEIDHYVKVYKTPPFGREVEGTVELLERCRDIIRKHMNGGWIPVEERMPEAPEMEDEYPEFNVMIEGAKTPTTLQYSHDGVWVDDYGNAYNVIAWQPLPEPYKPKPQNKPEEHYPDWRTKFLGKFDKRV